ncbi:bifunctional folylpolyglutamate synthase/dihydrofolate synthase [Clostridium botulinum]|uniref:bifunctional folylpolyglutamate synthase/dihydrofolate synthase n=1 Tax=Clostridium botulinum TaxID=1491 RepID=UPI000174EB25|nr:folylpolyglutamate synthase/dihydrofolate synthase family protein [Clostridium botulinum]ACD52484.1 folylpolyglutamate synthase [Clostridium botulinum E3 str. Alaska E43]MBY6788666.1 bifunctional folylpolyglutamate synthase/dihydrofolate synthase [Clostridium botulinum]MBY6816322.1 bifunctional folylpolyglutamate synthase/dihydrofolate synthase [Clostridium botulinum]MBY6827423.1 bifunctional folylpolyglutamate synthase/dihydrofolate synthase [Clostridium botulinum]MBY6859370.1 bifunctional
MKMNYEEAMNYISSVGRFGSNYGLKRTYRLLELLGEPQKKLKLIHVAGTNGKGSTTSMITSILIGMGYKVGMYTSPFLEEFEERIQINGENIPKNKLTELINTVKKAVDKVIEEGYEHPTEFEILTTAMYLYYYNEKVDYAVIEVGLGGELDSTNVITPIVSVITSISFDHMNILGNSLYEIAMQKAGIIKEEIPVVVYPQTNEAMRAIIEKAKITNSKVCEINSNSGTFIEVKHEEKFYQKVKIDTGKELYNANLPLMGEHQILNLSVALTTIEILCEREGLILNKKLIENSIESVKWKGRLEVLNKEPLIVMDGAHNIEGIKMLKSNVKKYFKYNNVFLLLGILADKQVEEMIKEITPMAYKVYVLTPHSDRAELNTELKDHILKYNKNTIALDSYEDAMKTVLSEATSEDLILISGSLYMIGDMRKIITQKIMI